ncbi:hypothetical protein BH11MYX4_BH11MYX4_34100 [soil metagenome]
MKNFARLGSMMLAAATLLAVAATASADGKTTPAGGSASASAKRLCVKRLVLAHGIDRHEPQDASGTFKSSDDRVYAFIELENPGKLGGAISVVFEPPSGPPVAEIPLSVGETSRFRTWAFTRKARTAGEWTVVVRDGEHRVLARQTFTVT